LYLSLCTRLPPSSTLFPYTTLFRSLLEHAVLVDAGLVGEGVLADDGLVALHLHTGDVRHQPAGGVELARVDGGGHLEVVGAGAQDRKSTRLNSSHVAISYAVFCLKK